MYKQTLLPAIWRVFTRRWTPHTQSLSPIILPEQSGVASFDGESTNPASQ